MKIIVGLGNHGKKYEHTRHNAGFLALDFLLEIWNIKPAAWKKKFDAEILNLDHLDKKSEHADYMLVKPQTFMNDSGKAVKAICDFYKVDINNKLLVIHDDSDLLLGDVRVTNSSSSAGHNGVQNIIDNLNTQNFHRIRIGVESRLSKKDMSTEAFVLSNFKTNELDKLKNDIFPLVQYQIENFFNN